MKTLVYIRSTATRAARTATQRLPHVADHGQRRRSRGLFLLPIRLDGHGTDGRHRRLCSTGRLDAGTQARMAKWRGGVEDAKFRAPSKRRRTPYRARGERSHVSTDSVSFPHYVRPRYTSPREPISRVNLASLSLAIDGGSLRTSDPLATRHSFRFVDVNAKSVASSNSHIISSRLSLDKWPRQFAGIARARPPENGATESAVM